MRYIGFLFLFPVLFGSVQVFAEDEGVIAICHDRSGDFRKYANRSVTLSPGMNLSGACNKQVTDPLLGKIDESTGGFQYITLDKVAVPPGLNKCAKVKAKKVLINEFVKDEPCDGTLSLHGCNEKEACFNGHIVSGF